MTNARIKDIGNGLMSEAVATDIHLRYNPATGKTQIDFHFQDCVTLADGTPIGDYTTGRYDVISVQMDALGPTQPGVGVPDPVTGARLDFVSGFGIETIIKIVCDKVYNDRAATQNASGMLAPFTMVS